MSDFIRLLSEGEKCKEYKSLALAHGLEAHFIAPEVEPKNNRGWAQK